MDMATALAELGVAGDTIDAETREQLDREGYAILTLHSCFTRRGNRQQLDQQKYIRPQTLAALSPAARFILDV